MKNLFKFVFALGIFITTMAFGQDTTFSKFLEVGKLHNDGLEHYYQSLIKNPKQMNIEGIQSDILQFSKSNESLSGFSEQVAEGSKLYLEKYLHNSLEKVKETSEERDENIKSQLSEVQNEYFDKILNIEAYSSADDYKNSIVKFMNDLSRDERMEQNEKNLLYLAAGIGIASSEYWEQNTVKWMQLSSTTESTSKLPANFWKNFVKEDIKGGICGGLGGALAGGVTIPVIGAVPGWVVGAVGGALAGSASWGVAEILWP